MKTSKLKEKTQNSRKKPKTQGKNLTCWEQFLRPPSGVTKKAWFTDEIIHVESTCMRS